MSFEGRALPLHEAPAPSWTPRLVALDIDGTIVDGAQPPTVGVSCAVKRAAGTGAEVVLVTGRPPMEITGIIRDLELSDGAAICSNGAVTVAFHPLRLVEAVTFHPGPIVDRILDEAPGVLVAIEDLAAGYLVSAPFPEGELEGRQTVHPVEVLTSGPVSRVLLRDPSASVEEFLAVLNGLNLPGVRCLEAHKPWIDVTVAGVDKRSALMRVAARLGLGANDCLAIGDGRNDIPMLRWARAGVAMGHAADDVKAAARYTTSDVADDGLAKVLDYWFG